MLFLKLILIKYKTIVQEGILCTKVNHNYSDFHFVFHCYSPPICSILSNSFHPRLPVAVTYTNSSFQIVGIPSPYARFEVGRRMAVASPDSVILFNYRGSEDILDKLVFISGRRTDGSSPKDGTKALHRILKDAIANHDKACLKLPKRAIIKMQSK